MDREIYPNAQLQLVAFELRHPLVAELGGGEPAGPVKVYDRLRDKYPILTSLGQGLEWRVGASAAAQSIPIGGAGIRMFNRKRTSSVTVGSNSVVVETADYLHFESFLEDITEVIAAVARVSRISGMERVGLRYINEIRAPGIERPSDWEPYLDPRLLGPVKLLDSMPVATLQTIVEYAHSEGRACTMRFGALEGHVVDPAGPLRVRDRGSGAYFLIDLDSYWSAPPEEVPEFSEEGLLDVTTSLRKPVRSLFEASITESLRQDLLRLTEKGKGENG